MGTAEPRNPTSVTNAQHVLSALIKTSHPTSRIIISNNTAQQRGRECKHFGEMGIFEYAENDNQTKKKKD